MMKYFVEIGNDDDLSDFLKWKEQRLRIMNREHKFHSVPNTESLPLTVRNAIGRSGAETLDEAKLLSDTDWLKVPNVGRKTLSEIRKYF